MFRVSARTVLQLGAELISSDAVAFYELIKNAFDANSKRVMVRVVTRIPFEVLPSLRDYLGVAGDSTKPSKVRREALETAKTEIAAHVNAAAPDASDYRTRIEASRTAHELLELLDEASSIEFADTGEGMSLEDLDTVYLTIGTPSRLKTRATRKASEKERPVLGEKGIGRLSVMRLGMRVRVESTKAGETTWNVLEIDWRDFLRDIDALIESVPVRPVKGAKKDNPADHGTHIYITALNGSWSAETLKDIAAVEFAKIMDPFTEKTKFPIAVYFNKAKIEIPPFNRLLFEHAHATVTAALTFDAGGPALRGHVSYARERKERSFVVEGVQLKSVTGVGSLEVLRSLGPFAMEAHWYNRRILEEITGIGDREQVRELIRAWSGGLMVFRDGFRVPPYGGPNDDWLDLDRRALAGQAFKVNRAQLIGKVDVTSSGNPRLVDQTNREGLRDCPEKAALQKLLQHVLVGQLRGFLEIVDKANRKPVSFAELEDLVEAEEKSIGNAIARLRGIAREFPKIDVAGVESALRESLRQIERTMADAKSLAAQYDQDRSQVIHLAGLGMMVEHIAHELVRTTEHTLRTISDSLSSRVTGDIKTLLRNVESQLVSLRKRLTLLDPLTTSGRQVKEPVALTATIQEILDGHSGQFKRHGISGKLESIPARSDVTLKLVKGMFMQIVENLISNSVYWLKQQQDVDPSFKPSISIAVDIRALEVRFTDNGPGIPPADREDVFRAFYTRKPPGAGKGLGLYISQQIAEYHGARLYIDDATSRVSGNHNTFVLDLSKAKS